MSNLDSVADVKQRITDLSKDTDTTVGAAVAQAGGVAASNGVSSAAQRLFYMGKELPDQQSLGAAQVKEGWVVQAIVRS